MVLMAKLLPGSGKLVVSPSMKNGADDAVRVAYSWVRLHQEGNLISSS